MRRLVNRYPRVLTAFGVAVATAGVALAQQATVVGTLDGHTDPVYAIAWSPDGKTLATASFDNTVRLWEAATRKEIKKYDGHSKMVLAVAFSPDGKQILSGSQGQNRQDLGFGPSVEEQKAKAEGERESGAASGTPKTLAGHTGEIYSVAWSPDGKLAATGAADKTARIWDVAKGTAGPIDQRPCEVVYAVAFNPKGDLLVTGGDDKLIKYWNVADGKELRKSRATERRSTGLAFHPDGTKLASGSVDKTIRIWNVADGKELHKLDGHPDDVYSIAFSPDGKRLASVGYGGNIYVWDVATAKPLVPPAGRPPHPDLRPGLEPRRPAARRGRVG